MAKARKSGGGSLLLLLVLILVLAALIYHHTHPGPASSSPAAGRYAAPTHGTITSGYGPRPGGMHHGIDIANHTGTPIRAVTDARVIQAGPATGFGLWMRLRGQRHGTVTVYGHLHTIEVAQGAHVAAGQQIATMGARGDATGPHLHFEVWPHGQRANRINPTPWLSAHGIHL